MRAREPCCRTRRRPIRARSSARWRSSSFPASITASPRGERAGMLPLATLPRGSASMSPESDDLSKESGDALGEALRIFIEHRASGSGASDSELLRQHPDLRELLQPLLEQDASSAGEVRAGAVIGDYRLVEAIGRGGMGEVWEAEQISLKRRVALKLLREHVFASSHSIERFKREALAGARLQHPCIVAVHAVGESNGIHFIAQELIESRRTLAALIRDAREAPAISPSWWRATAQL